MNRDTLYTMLDTYLSAMDANDAGKVPWSADARFSENNVMLEPGDGIWNTLTGRGTMNLRFADEKTGEVGFFGNVDEQGEKALFGLRLKVTEDQVAEAESVVARPHDSGVPFLTPGITARPEFEEAAAPADRTPRKRMVELADGYFDTLQQNDGTIKTVFEATCERRENGFQTTNNPDSKLAWWSQLGCQEQFELGIYRYNDRVRRWHKVVDEDRGLVLSTGFIDHSGSLRDYKLTDGRDMQGFFKRPHSFYLQELFKIRRGALQSVEAIFTTVPYHMPSPWPH